MRFALTTALLLALAAGGCGSNAAAGGGTSAGTDATGDAGNGAETSAVDAADAAVADTAGASDTAAAADGKSVSDSAVLADSNAPADSSVGIDAAAGPDGQGDAKVTGDVGLPAPIAIDNLIQALLSSLCKGVPTCPNGQIGSISFATESGCKAFFGSSNLAAIEEIVASVKAGKTKYDPQQAAICFGEFAAMCGANDDATASPACTATFTGTVESGGVCAFNEQCKSSWCKKSSVSCPGTCGTKGAVGAGCQNQKECADGLLCVTQKCTSPAAMKIGSSCDGPNQCGKDMFCNEADLPGSCQKLLAKGANCSGGGCQTGLVCALSGPGVATCIAKIALGADCSGLVSMGNPDPLCTAGFCSGPPNGAKTCKLKPGINGKCDAATSCKDFDLGCVPSADGQTGTCKVLPLKGEKCLSVIQFGVSTSACSPLGSCKNGICGAPPVEGEPCGMEGFCADGFSCGDGGVCKGLPGKGETCFGDCKKGFTCQGADETGPGKCVEDVCP